jgi:hypothetical protein
MVVRRCLLASARFWSHQVWTRHTPGRKRGWKHVRDSSLPRRKMWAQRQTQSQLGPCRLGSRSRGCSIGQTSRQTTPVVLWRMCVCGGGEGAVSQGARVGRGGKESLVWKQGVGSLFCRALRYFASRTRQLFPCLFHLPAFVVSPGQDSTNPPSKPWVVPLPKGRWRGQTHLKRQQQEEAPPPLWNPRLPPRGKSLGLRELPIILHFSSMCQCSSKRVEKPSCVTHHQRSSMAADPQVVLDFKSWLAKNETGAVAVAAIHALTSVRALSPTTSASSHQSLSADSSSPPLRTLG